MSGVFEGLEVLEVTRGIAGPMTGMVLADHGARVTRIDPPGGDPLSDHPGQRVWDRGKRSAVVDLSTAAGREVFLGLARTADVVLDSLAPGAMERLGLGHDDLAAVNARIISCSITGYGVLDEHRDRPGYEALVAARAGNQWAQRGGIMSTGELGIPDVEIPEGAEQAARPDGPIFSGSPWMSINGFYAATLAIASALVAREEDSVGQHIEASMLPRAAYAPATERSSGPMSATWMNLKGAPRGLFECKDGRWVHQWPIKPQTVVDAGEYDRLDDAPTPEYPHRRVDPNRIAMDPENIVVLFFYIPLMQEAFKRHDAEDWRKWGERVKEGVQIVRSPEEALSDPSLLDDGSVVEIDDPELGPIRHIGVITELNGCPGAVQGPAPRLGEHTDAVLSEANAVDRTAAPTSASPTAPPVRDPDGPTGPLAGVRVLDIGLALAGPYGTSLLADLGADVIKVMAPWDGPWMEMGIGQLANRGKRGVLLHLGQPHGLAAFHELVGTADVVAHNMRWNVAERIGVGYDDLREINPRLVYCESRGFDLDRSSRGVPGTDQSGSALAGQEWEDGGMWDGGRPFYGTSMGDLGNGFLAAIAVTQALYHRARTGHGQKVGTSILNACLATSSRTFTFPDGSGPERPTLDGLQLGFHALYRLYEAADGWVCVAAIRDGHWRDLCSAIERRDLLGDDRFRDRRSRLDNDAELAGIIGEVLADRSASHWFTTLDRAGVPVEVSALGQVEIPAGTPFLDFSRTPASAPREAPRLGEHTDEILAELTLSPDEIEAVRTETASRARS